MNLRYLIGKDADPGTDDSITVIGYDATTPPKNGVKYCNLLDEKNTGKYGPHIHSETGDEYNEPAPDPERKGFWDNLREQLDRAKSQGFTSVELDNLDTYTASVALLCFNEVRAHGLTVWAKNPAIVSGNREAILAHSAVVGVIVERDCGSPGTYDAMRKAAGKQNLPIRFVSYGGGRNWAQQTAGTIQAADYRNMGVTYSSDGEYGSSEDVLLPINPTAENPMPTGAEIIAKAKSYIGKLEDGPDVPRISREIYRNLGYAEDSAFAKYCRQAYNDMPWCGAFIAYVLSQFKISPAPFSGDTGFFWVDTWAKWGTNVPVSQAQPGDVAVFLGGPHHVAFCAGGGRYVGGNQNDAVTESGFRTPDYVRRAPAANAQPVVSTGGRQTKITATVWNDAMGAYGPIDHSEPCVSLPAPFPRNALPLVRVYGPGGVAEGPVTDKGPWYDGTSARPADRYWETGQRPRAESDSKTNGAGIDLNPAMAEAVGIDGKGLVDWEFVKDAVKPVDDEPDDQPVSIPAVEAALKDIVAALRPILEKHMEPKPVTQSNFDWGKLLQPLLAELAPKIVPLLMPYVAQMLPQLLPYLLDAMFGRRQSVMSKPGVQMGGSALGGGLLVAIADHFLTK